jgi:CheY-like chemotaxis protein
MSTLYCKLVPLIISGGLFFLAFRVHERYWSLGFIGWRKVYLGLAALFIGSLASVLFEFAELRRWQEVLGWPLDWLVLGLGASLGLGLVLHGGMQRMALAVREKDELAVRQEAFDLFDSIRDATQGPYSFLEILNFSLKEIIRKIGADAGGIWLLHPSGKEYILASASGFALSLQQTLECVSATHSGFSRAAGEASPREISDAATIRRFFPELAEPMGGYATIFTCTLIGGHGPLQERKPLGVLMCGSHLKGIISPTDSKLIGSAVAFLATVISEVRVSRTLRNERRSRQQVRENEREFFAWIAQWSAETRPEHKLQSAVAELGSKIGEFIGCGRYLPEDKRWEPLALTAGESNMMFLGSNGFRKAAAQAVATRQKTAYTPPEEDGPSNSPEYRMIPVICADAAAPYNAVLFIPRLERPPVWWDQAVQLLIELTSIVLLNRRADDAGAEEKGPFPEEILDLNRLLDDALYSRAEDLPGLLAKVLPAGKRAAYWQSLPGVRPVYHLRLAFGADVPAIYHSSSELLSASAADDLETNAHLGGLVRVDYKGTGTLSETWPDFGAGWRAWRFPIPSVTHNRGWLSIYHHRDAAEPDEREMRLFKTLVRLVDVVLIREDFHAADYSVADQPGEVHHHFENPPPVADEPETVALRHGDDLPQPPSTMTIDRAITNWISAQGEHVRPGRIDFPVADGNIPIVNPVVLNEIFDWGLANFADGILARPELRINALLDRDRISVVFDRGSAIDFRADDQNGQPAAAVPFKQSIRETLELWDARLRIINGSDAPRKLLLSFTPRERRDAPEPVHMETGVLVVDEEELIRDLLLGMLDVLGYRAQAAVSAEQGLRLFERGGFDFIIAGQGLAGAEKFATQARELRRDIRIVAVGEPKARHTETPRAPWCDTALVTPFRIEDLRGALEPEYIQA